ncbi:hypothetical protein ACWFNE_02790 [Cellulomonas sp. NPDC055163]
MRRSLPSALLAAALLLPPVLGGCSPGPSESLRLLRAESLAAVAVPGTSEGQVTETDEGRTGGKQQHARLQRRLPLVDGAQPSEVLAAAQRLAEEDGWEQVPSGPSAWLATKVVAAHPLELTVSVSERGGAPRLVIELLDRS